MCDSSMVFRKFSLALVDCHSSVGQEILFLLDAEDGRVGFCHPLLFTLMFFLFFCCGFRVMRYNGDTFTTVLSCSANNRTSKQQRFNIFTSLSMLYSKRFLPNEDTLSKLSPQQKLSQHGVTLYDM